MNTKHLQTTTAIELPVQNCSSEKVGGCLLVQSIHNQNEVELYNPSFVGESVRSTNPSLTVAMPKKVEKWLLVLVLRSVTHNRS